jgi:hypothetical protein
VIPHGRLYVNPLLAGGRRLLSVGTAMVISRAVRLWA